MLEFDIVVIGREATQRKLRHGRAFVERHIGRRLTGWAQRTTQERLSSMRNYAPPPPNSSYIRTGNLGSSFRVRRSGAVQVSIINKASYASYVIGRGDRSGQAGIHRGRWWLLQDRVVRALPPLLREIAADLNRIWGR